MKRRVYIFINGIMNIPGAAAGWNGRAVTCFHVNTPDRAEKLEYFCGPVGRALGQRRRVRKLAPVIRQYQAADYDIVLVGHSNGCDVILDTLHDLKWPRIEELHLISGACEASFDKNGLNHALRREQVGRVFVYVGGKDFWLWLAHGWLGRMLGYGTLGLHGALDIATDADSKVQAIREPAFGHSSWWTKKNFFDTMSMIANPNPITEIK